MSFFPCVAVFVQGSLDLFHDAVKNLIPLYENVYFNPLFLYLKTKVMEQNLNGYYL